MDTNENKVENSTVDNTQPVMFTPPTAVPTPEVVPPVSDATSTVPTVETVPVVEPTPVVPAAPVVEPTPVVPATPATSVNASQPSVLGETTNLPVLGETSSIPVVDNKPDERSMEAEKLKTVEINYKPPSKAKTVLLILFFVGLIAFVIFLPDITTMIAKYKAGDLDYTPEEVTTGKLKCTLNTNTTNLDKDYDLTFSFTESKLERTYFVITTRGDATLDEATLDDLAHACKELENSSNSIEGFSVQCSYSDGKLVETQKYELESLDTEKVDAAFIEAGGNNPEYQYGQDIDLVERGMNASGYTCKREK